MGYGGRMKEMRNVHKFFAWEPQGKRPC